MDVTKKLSSLQEISKAQLSKILCTNQGAKFLILEPTIIRPLERVCGVRWLKANGVEKIFKLETTPRNFTANAVFYMIFTATKTFKDVVDEIRSVVDIENPIKNKFHIVVVPSIPYNFEEHLEHLGLFDIVTLHPFHWMPLHLDQGVLSLELPNVFDSLFVYETLHVLRALSNTLWKLTLVTGKPNVILSVGVHSNALVDQFNLLCEEKGHTDKIDSDFGALLVLDRNIDYPSALLTPATYSGLLNEVYNVNAGICEFKQDTTDAEERKLDEKCNPVPNKHHVYINLDGEQDTVYADIKNRYFTEVTSVLSNLTKQLKSEQSNSKEMALDEIKRYVQTQLQATKSRKKFITNHLMAAESIINVLGHRYEAQRQIESDIVRNNNRTENIAYLDELLATENDPKVTLRLFCLICLTQKLSESEIQSFWLKFVHQFGFQYGFCFENLVTAGFVPDSPSNIVSMNLKLPPVFSSSNFINNAKIFRQIPADLEKINLKHPTCASYVFGGAYIPLIAQIVGLLLNSVPLEDIKQKLENFGGVCVSNEEYPLSVRAVLVYVVGGVTYAEIAACNLLETLLGAKICIVSDKIISGNDLIDGLLKFPS